MSGSSSAPRATDPSESRAPFLVSAFHDRQNAGVKKLLPLFLVLFVAALAWRFWPEEAPVEAAGPEEGTPVFVPLDAPDPVGDPEPEAGLPAEPEAAPVSAAPPTSATAGIRALNLWHRSSGRNWSPEAGQEGVAAPLAAFAQIWQGSAGSYAAELRIEVPAALGPAFQGFAAAFADGGLPALAGMLARDSARGPAWNAWSEALVVEALRTQEDRLAGPALGRLLEQMVADDYDRERILGLGEYAATLRSRAQAWARKEPYKVVSGDSLDSIGRKYRAQGSPLRFGWMMEFNRKRSDTIRLDETLQIPLDPLHLLGLRSKCILALYCGDTPIHLYEVSFGKPGQETPVGTFTLTDFLVEPIDYGLDPPVPYGHPDHRLGTRWMGFAEAKEYGIHGNNVDDQVGAHESAGCVRMINGEVEQLFELIPRNGKVEIRP